jgi:hypothetical protein
VAIETLRDIQRAASSAFGAGGGGAGYYVGLTPPADPVANPLWFNLTTGAFLTYVDDGSSAQWVEAGGNVVPTGGSTGQVLRKVSGADFDLEWVDPAALPTSVTLIVPSVAASGLAEVIVADAAVTGTSKIRSSLIPEADAENDYEELIDSGMSISALPEAGQIRFVLSGKGAFVGPFKAMYEVFA